MKLENIIYSIRKVLKSEGVDSRIDDRFLIDLINRYRAFNIELYYKEHHQLKQEWFSNLGIINTPPVNSSDDPSIQYTSVIFGKYVFPKTVTIPNVNTKNIRSASKHQRIEEIDQHILYKMIETEDELLKEYSTVHYIGDTAYVYPHLEKIWGSAIIEDPRDAITHNELTDFEGNIISPAGTARNLTVTDEYPLCGELSVRVILDILTKEFAIEKGNIPDMSIDSAETDELVKSPI